MPAEMIVRPILTICKVLCHIESPAANDCANLPTSARSVQRALVQYNDGGYGQGKTPQGRPNLDGRENSKGRVKAETSGRSAQARVAQ